MKIDDVRQNAYSMPLTSPSFPPGPYRFFNREYFVITYRTDPDALAAVVPEPLEVARPVVNYEFIRMPVSTGFGDYTETGQVIPVRFKDEEGVYVHSMYLDDDAPIAGGRELWGFPKKLASPKIAIESDVLVGTLHYGSVLCASGTMPAVMQLFDCRWLARPSGRAATRLSMTRSVAASWSKGVGSGQSYWRGNWKHLSNLLRIFFDPAPLC